jgi:hypothetical protein
MVKILERFLVGLAKDLASYEDENRMRDLVRETKMRAQHGNGISVTWCEDDSYFPSRLTTTYYNLIRNHVPQKYLNVGRDIAEVNRWNRWRPAIITEKTTLLGKKVKYLMPDMNVEPKKSFEELFRRPKPDISAYV